MTLTRIPLLVLPIIAVLFPVLLSLGGCEKKPDQNIPAPQAEIKTTPFNLPGEFIFGSVEEFHKLVKRAVTEAVVPKNAALIADLREILHVAIEKAFPQTDLSASAPAVSETKALSNDDVIEEDEKRMHELSDAAGIGHLSLAKKIASEIKNQRLRDFENLQLQARFVDPKVSIQAIHALTMMPPSIQSQWISLASLLMPAGIDPALAAPLVTSEEEAQLLSQFHASWQISKGNANATVDSTFPVFTDNKSGTQVNDVKAETFLRDSVASVWDKMLKEEKQVIDGPRPAVKGEFESSPEFEARKAKEQTVLQQSHDDLLRDRPGRFRIHFSHMITQGPTWTLTDMVYNADRGEFTGKIGTTVRDLVLPVRLKVSREDAPKIKETLSGAIAIPIWAVDFSDTLRLSGLILFKGELVTWSTSKWDTGIALSEASSKAYLNQKDVEQQKLAAEAKNRAESEQEAQRKKESVLNAKEPSISSKLTSLFSSNIDGQFDCRGTVYTFSSDGMVTSSKGIRPMKYKLDGKYILILTPANEWLPLLKKNGSDVTSNSEGTGYADDVCAKN